MSEAGNLVRTHFRLDLGGHIGPAAGSQTARTWLFCFARASDRLVGPIGEQRGLNLRISGSAPRDNRQSPSEPAQLRPSRGSLSLRPGVPPGQHRASVRCQDSCKRSARRQGSSRSPRTLAPHRWRRFRSGISRDASCSIRFASSTSSPVSSSGIPSIGVAWRSAQAQRFAHLADIFSSPLDGLRVHGDITTVCCDVAGVIPVDMEDGAACLDVPTFVLGHVSSVAFYTVVTCGRGLRSDRTTHLSNTDPTNEPLFCKIGTCSVNFIGPESVTLKDGVLGV